LRLQLSRSFSFFVIMSAPSNAPSLLSDDDNWQGFTSSLITSLPALQTSSSGSATTSPPSQPSLTGSSGKFNSFTFVGASLTGGGAPDALYLSRTHGSSMIAYVWVWWVPTSSAPRIVSQVLYLAVPSNMKHPSSMLCLTVAM